MNRRQFIFTGLGSAAAGLVANPSHAKSTPGIETVQGSISPARLGITLAHEHVLVDFAGAAVAGQKRYDSDEVFRVVLPHLNRIRELGCQTLVECTPAYLGRDVRLLKRLSEASRLQILTNTGYYGAAADKGVPTHAFSESAEQLAARWIKECHEGIEGTRIKPAFIKTGVDKSPLSEIDAKLLRAAALTHLATGLVIAAHTTDETAAREELLILKSAGVHPSAWIWVHAQSASDPAAILAIAAQGAWISLDGIGEKSLDQHLKLLQALEKEKRLNQVLLSQDAGWYHVGEPGGGDFRSFDFLLTHFLPALTKEGFSEKVIQQLLSENPRRAFTPAVKRL
jgi:predicted metal-dependent phosphotriesterase family hydrolase